MIVYIEEYIEVYILASCNQNGCRDIKHLILCVSEYNILYSVLDMLYVKMLNVSVKFS